MVRGYRIERFSHHMTVHRREGVWSPVRSVRDFMPEELEALHREGFDFRGALHHPLLQVDSAIQADGGVIGHSRDTSST